MKTVCKILLAISLLSLASCKSQQWPYENLKGDTELMTLLVVDLQTGYNGEEVTLWINEEIMLDGSKASTVPESSFTGLKVSFFKGVGNLVPEIVHKFDNNKSEVVNSPISIDSEVDIKIRIVGLDGEVVEQSTNVRVDKGKYVGFSLSGSGQVVVIRQSSEPFNYL